MSTLSAFVALFCLVASVAVCLAWDKIVSFILPKKGYDFSRERQHYNPTKKKSAWYERYIDFQRRRKLKTFLSLALMAVFLGACTNGQGPIKIDGQVDEVEASLIKVAVGAAMSAMPETIIPAYAISTALMQSDLDVITSVAGLDTAISIELKRLHLTQDEEASFMELVGALKAGIRQRLGGTSGYDYGVVIRAVIEAVNSAAKARLPIDNASRIWIDDTMVVAAEKTNTYFNIPKSKDGQKAWMVERGFLLSDDEIREITP